MNCAECREALVAFAEGLLNPEESVSCRTHLEGCAGCRSEHDAVGRLQERLTARGRLAADASVLRPVMRRIQSVPPKSEPIIMKLFAGWGMRTALGVTTVLLGLFLALPNANINASEIMAKGAEAMAKLRTVHFRGRLRTAPQDNFSAINPEAPFCAVELWKQFEPGLKWRIDKPQRAALMDGASTLLYIRPANLAARVPQPAASAFDTEWLHRIANLSDTITSELKNAQAAGWGLKVAQKRGADGRPVSVVTVSAKAGVPEADYLKNKFFDASDTRRVYFFDSESGLLQRVEIYLSRPGRDLLILELDEIDCNAPIDPAVFQLDLPADVAWHRDEMPILPDNDRYAKMSAEEAARGYFEALQRSDWAEADKFRKDPIGERTKQIAGGLQLLKLGQAFSSDAYEPTGRFVPYEIKVRNGEVLRHNIALKKDPKSGRWFVDGGAF